MRIGVLTRRMRSGSSDVRILMGCGSCVIPMLRDCIVHIDNNGAERVGRTRCFRRVRIMFGADTLRATLEWHWESPSLSLTVSSHLILCRVMVFLEKAWSFTLFCIFYQSMFSNLCHPSTNNHSKRTLAPTTTPKKPTPMGSRSASEPNTFLPGAWTPSF